MSSGAFAAKSPAWRISLAKRARVLLWVCGAASCTAPISRQWPDDLLPSLHWVLGLAAHWQWLYLSLGLSCLLLSLLVRRFTVWLLLPAAALLSCFFWQSPTLDAAAKRVDSSQVLRVATANLNLHTTDFGPLVHWLSASQAPDLVFLQEYTAQAQQALAQSPVLKARYPHRLEWPQSDPFGLAILSREPLLDAQRRPSINPYDTLGLRATLLWQGQRVRLSAVHPMPPLSAAYARRRDALLREEARELTQDGGLALLAGDLNTTPWARSLFALAPALKRANSISASWPQIAGGLSLLPLDHVLGSAAWLQIDSVHGPDLGSDHRPVVVRLTPRAQGH